MQSNPHDDPATRIARAQQVEKQFRARLQTYSADQLVKEAPSQRYGSSITDRRVEQGSAKDEYPLNKCKIVCARVDSKITTGAAGLLLAGKKTPTSASLKCEYPKQPGCRINQSCPSNNHSLFCVSRPGMNFPNKPVIPAQMDAVPSVSPRSSVTSRALVDCVSGSYSNAENATGSPSKMQALCGLRDQPCRSSGSALTEKRRPSDNIEEIRVIAKEIRIGNFLLKDRPAIFAPNKLSLVVRPVDSHAERIELNFAYGDIVKVIWALTAVPPGVLFNMSPRCGKEVRELLKMKEDSRSKVDDDSRHPYFDPASPYERKRRIITIFEPGVSTKDLEKICSFYASPRSSLHKEFSEKMLAMTKPDCTEYETPIADGDVSKSSGTPGRTLPARLQGSGAMDSPLMAPGNGMRLDIGGTEAQPQDSNGDRVDTTNAQRSMDPSLHLCYYPPGEIGAIELKIQDIQTLAADSFLNDNIIEFFMKYLQSELLDPKIAEKTFIFNTFFYNSLINVQSRRKGQEEKKTPTSRRRHENVKRWTKRVDIFKKDFIVIPICQNSHWFLAIICYPWLVLAARGIQVDEGVDEASTTAKESLGGKERRAAIYVFDSLRGSVQCARVYSTLRDYLTEECLDKKKIVCSFDYHTMRGFYPNCPQQTNLHDCGIFVMEFAKAFLSNPPPVDEINNCQIYREMFNPDLVMQKRRMEISQIILNLYKSQHSGGDTLPMRPEDIGIALEGGSAVMSQP